MDIEYIKEHDVLEDEYDKIIDSLENRSVIERVDFSDLEFFDFKAGSGWVKFFTGAGMWFAFVILTPFIYKSLGDAIKAIVMLIVLGFVFGGIALIIPIILVPIVNYIMVPCLEVLFVYWISKYSKKKNNPE